MLARVPIAGAPLSSNAYPIDANITGYIAISEAPDIANIPIVSAPAFIISAVENQDTVTAGLASVTTVQITASEPADVLAASVSAVNYAALSATDGADIAAIIANIIGTASLAATESKDTASFPDVTLIYSSFPTPIAASAIGAGVAWPDLSLAVGYMTATDGADSVSVNLTVGVAELSATDQADSASISADIVGTIYFPKYTYINSDFNSAIASAPIAGSIKNYQTYNSPELPDGVNIDVEAVTTDYLDVTEAPDAASIITAFLSTGDLAATEAKDTASITLKVGVITLAATEAADGSSISLAIVGSLYVASTEAEDYTDISAYGQWGELLTAEDAKWQLVA